MFNTIITVRSTCLIRLHRRSSVMLEHRCCDAANLVSGGSSPGILGAAGEKNDATSGFLINVTDRCVCWKTQFVGAWCGGVTGPFPSYYLLI